MTHLAAVREDGIVVKSSAFGRHFVYTDPEAPMINKFPVAVTRRGKTKWHWLKNTLPMEDKLLSSKQLFDILKVTDTGLRTGAHMIICASSSRPIKAALHTAYALHQLGSVRNVPHAITSSRISSGRCNVTTRQQLEQLDAQLIFPNSGKMGGGVQPATFVCKSEAPSCKCQLARSA